VLRHNASFAVLGLVGLVSGGPDSVLPGRGPVTPDERSSERFYALAMLACAVICFNTLQRSPW
jgi:hypothetical protein